VCNIVTPPSGTLSGYPGPPTATDFSNYNADITSVVNEFAANQFLIVDCDGALAQTSNLFASSGLGGTGGTNIHPNDRGYAKLAQAIYNAIMGWVIGIPINEQAMQSRVMRRVTARSLAVRRYMNGVPIGTPGPTPSPTDLLGRPSNGGGDYVLPNAMAKLDATNLQITLDAQIGDEIQVELYGLLTWSSGSQAAFDVAFLDGNGNPIRYFSGNIGTDGVPMAAIGWPAWYQPSVTPAATTPAQTHETLSVVSGSAFATVMPGDSPVNQVGIVTVALYGQSSSAARTLYGGNASNEPPLVFHVRNLGQRNTPGFNAS
jgi:hypothetical protein